MFGSVFSKSLYDKRWFFMGWALGSIALLTLTTGFYPVIADSIGTLLDTIPPALSSIVGEAGAYSTYSGYIGSAVFGIRAEMLFVPLAIILGLGLSVNEELSRRLYQLLAQPLSRRRIAIERWLGGVVVIAGIMLLIYASLVITSLLVGEDVPYEVLARIVGMGTLFTIAIFSLTYGLGVAFGRRGLAIIIPVVWVMGSLLLDSFGAQVEWLKHLDWLSVHYYYDSAILVKNSVQVEDIIVLGGISILSLITALLLFNGRDIREAE
jgi:ABC-2 type transport system permease protein